MVDSGAGPYKKLLNACHCNSAMPWNTVAQQTPQTKKNNNAIGKGKEVLDEEEEQQQKRKKVKHCLGAQML